MWHVCGRRNGWRRRKGQNKITVYIRVRLLLYVTFVREGLFRVFQKNHLKKKSSGNDIDART